MCTPRLATIFSVEKARYALVIFSSAVCHSEPYPLTMQGKKKRSRLAHQHINTCFVLGAAGRSLLTTSRQAIVFLKNEWGVKTLAPSAAYASTRAAAKTLTRPGIYSDFGLKVIQMDGNASRKGEFPDLEQDFFGCLSLFSPFVQSLETLTLGEKTRLGLFPAVVNRDE